MFYSQSTLGFYSQEFHCDNIPSDAVEITADYHAELMEAQSSGKVISADDFGYPIAIDPAKPVRTIESLLAEVAAKRWQVETDGIMVAGVPIATDREAQSLLNSAFIDLQSGLINDTQWKAANGTFTLVTLVQLEPVAQAVAAHRRACFAAEQVHAEAINALETQAELDAYDINTDWPSGHR